MPRAILWSLVLAGWGLSVGAAAQRAGAFGASRDHPAIAYSTAAVTTRITALEDRLARGEVALRFEEETGYLRSVLHALGISVESQVLVYSGTSFQARLIHKRSPRAIYFDDNTAVAWVRGADVLEVAAQDPRQGTIFYTLGQTPAAPPHFTRQPSCLSCHLSWETLAVPGPMVLTTYPRRREADYANGYQVDHRAPLAERWGGWYATGAAVPPSVANLEMILPAMPPDGPAPVRAPVELTGEIDGRYPTRHSDVVALLVLEHQTRATNLLTRAGWEYRQAVGDGWREEASGALPPRVVEAIDELVDYLLFVDEAPFPGPIRGSSGFAEQFSARGPRDSSSRSLRDFDLQTRLFRYPLSYMVYSDAFTGLPEAVQNGIWVRVSALLRAPPSVPKYRHLTAEVREAIRGIVRETLKR